MKKILIILITYITIILSITSYGCFKKTANAQSNNNDFKIIRNGDERIYVHKETKVMYLFIKNGYAGGLCLMVDKNGNPLLWQGE